MYFYHIGKMNKISSIGLILYSLQLAIKTKYPAGAGYFV